jgi:hypothetical protein
VSEHASALGYAVPADGPGWTALGLALVAAVGAAVLHKRLLRGSTAGWVALWALGAAALSAAYVHLYLRGGPRIVDATSYWMQARAMAHGLLAWHVPAPTASFRGRFLLSSGEMNSPMLGVIFPPGYPALLALGFVARCPLAVGPALAAALVVASSALAWQLTARTEVVKIAAVASALCACLRYHTADTMSHGLAALLLTCALLFGLRAAAHPRLTRHRAALWIASGVACGWLAATRPACALALACVGCIALGVHVARDGPSRASSAALDVAALIAGAALPTAALAVQQHAVTGRWFESSQSLYYLLSDGPPGCFRYGFGSGIGCVVEHGPYVDSVVRHGHGLSSALITTARRLHLHLSDVANAEPIAIVALAGAWLTRRDPWCRTAALVPLALVAVYVPFYFDGSYPGAGARLLADALPIEHVFLAVAVVAWSDRFADRDRGYCAAVSGLAALMLAGFAVRTSHEHAKLRDRDGARPMYEPSVVTAQLGSDPRGLLLVASDHGFNLAHDPTVRSAGSGLVVARARHDDRDRMLWLRLGRPSTWEYIFDPWDPRQREPHVVARSMASSDPVRWRFEAEAEWPPLAQSGGYAAPTWLASGSCASSGLALGITRTDPNEACVTVEVPLPERAAWGVQPWLVVQGDERVRAWMQLGDGARLEWPLPDTLGADQWPGATAPGADGRRCLPLPELQLGGQPDAGQMTLCTAARWLGLDRVELWSLTPQDH